MPKVNQSTDDVRGLCLVQRRQHSEVLFFKLARWKIVLWKNWENTNFQEVNQPTGGLVFKNFNEFSP